MFPSSSLNNFHSGTFWARRVTWPEENSNYKVMGCWSCLQGYHVVHMWLSCCAWCVFIRRIVIVDRASCMRVLESLSWHIRYFLNNNTYMISVISTRPGVSKEGANRLYGPNNATRTYFIKVYSIIIWKECF